MDPHNEPAALCYVVPYIYMTFAAVCPVLTVSFTLFLLPIPPLSPRLSYCSPTSSPTLLSPLHCHCSSHPRFCSPLLPQSLPPPPRFPEMRFLENATRGLSVTARLSTGLSTGLNTGLSKGFSTGISRGLSTGLNTGRSTGFSAGISTDLSTNLTTGFSTGLTTSLNMGF